MTYDEEVLKCFIENQTKLFPEVVAESLEEADEFLEESMAVVCDSLKDVRHYFEDTGTDIEGMSDQDLLDAEEVFEVGDGRFIVVDA